MIGTLRLLQAHANLSFLLFHLQLLFLDKKKFWFLWEDVICENIVTSDLVILCNETVFPSAWASPLVPSPAVPPFLRSKWFTLVIKFIGLSTWSTARCDANLKAGIGFWMKLLCGSCFILVVYKLLHKLTFWFMSY